ncbi:MAG: putative regulatory protein (ArsR-family) [Acidimicrobiales bacterium]|nr:putative regulatory protein (ArsR-family) [Acidimicrobiales bacterium]
MPFDLLGVLAEPNRRKLLALLAEGERSVTDLAAEFAVTRSAISQHLTILVDAGLVEARQEGRFRFYRLVPGGVAALRAQIDGFWTSELDHLARTATRTASRTTRTEQGTAHMPYDKSVFVPVPPDEAFALVTEPERLRRWQVVAARVDLRAGGDYRWTVVPGHTAGGQVTEVDPGRRVVLSWGWEGDDSLPPGASTVTISLTPGDGGTFVRLVHEGLTEDQVVGHTEGWDHYLDRLVAAAADGDAGPDAWAAAPDPLDALNAAEASLAICQRALRDLDDAAGAKPTPCAEFDVNALIEHLLGSLTSMAMVAGADPSKLPAPGSPESLGARSSEAERRVADLGQVAIEAWRDRGTDGSVSMGPAEMPAELVAAILTIELLIHAWDAATATGRTITVAPELAEFGLGRLQALAAAGARTPDRFGPQVEAPADADALTRMLAFSGRRA